MNTKVTKVVLTEEQTAIKAVFAATTVGRFIHLTISEKTHSFDPNFKSGVYFVPEIESKKGAGTGNTFLILERNDAEQWQLGWREALDTANHGKNPVITAARVLTNYEEIGDFYGAEHEPIVREREPIAESPLEGV